MILFVVSLIVWSPITALHFTSQREQDERHTSCGVRSVTDEDKRIVGGKQSKAGAWPWQAALLYNGSQLCGGSLISPEWVVSAAHCFMAFDSKPDPAHWEVILGEHHLKNEDWLEQSRSVSDIYVHSDYQPSIQEPIDQDSLLSVPPDYDLAVIRLSRPVNINKFVSPICLLPRGVRFVRGKECYVTGWGHLQFKGRKPNTLREAKVRIVDQDKCNSRKSYRGQVNERALCAGFEEGGVDACQYDSGGPLSCEHDGRWYLTGVVSWGHECGNPHKYGVYADMEDMTDWVLDTILQHQND